VVDDPDAVLPRADVRLPIELVRGGTLAAVDAEALGHASGALGAGRGRKGDPIDPAVGIVFTPKIGDRLEPSQIVGEIHARVEGGAREAIARVRAAVTLVDGPVDAPPLVLEAFGEEEG
jgi:thymidine phosphorylase